jgi:hypothetical protein
MALGRYNGSRGKPQYPNAVFGASKAWNFMDPVPADKTPDPTRPADRAPAGPN